MISSRPTRPLPSRNGWIVSNCTWASAALTSTGSPSGSSCRKRSRSRHRRRRLRYGGGGTKRGVARAGAADPVLAAAELARAPSRCRARARGACAWISRIRRAHSGKPPRRRAEAVLQRRDVVRDLHDVVERHAGGLLHLEEQQVGERGLRALDLGGEHRLLADVGVEEKIGVWQQSGDAVEPPRARRACSRRNLDPPVKNQGWMGGSGTGMKARIDSPPTVVTS